MFEKFAEDVMVRCQQKLAALVKKAEEEQQQQPPQDPQPYPTNIREMDPRRAAEAMDFESRIYGPMVESDRGDLPNKLEWDILSKSPVLGNRQGMPQRYAETAMEQASGMGLPRPPYSDQLQQAIKSYEHPLHSQYRALENDPYGQGFKDDIDKNLFTLRDENTVNPEIPRLGWDARNPNRMLRQQQNFYPRIK